MSCINTALRLGLDYCPPVVGPYLRQQYHEPDWGYCLIAMEGIEVSGDSQLFCLRTLANKELLGTEKVSALGWQHVMIKVAFSLNTKF